jgi:monoamine oxidase
MKVVVVGAGLAGLTAAEQLHRAGADVVVVEASGRVGGRARTVNDRFVAGQFAESGAEWIDSNHLRMHGLLRRFGLTTVGAGERWSTIRRYLFHSGRLLGPDDMHSVEPSIVRSLDAVEAHFEELAEGIDDPSAPHRHADAARIDSMSLADVAASVASGAGPFASLYIRRNAQGEFADEPSSISALFVAQQRAQMREHADVAPAVAHRVAGGVQQIANGLRDALPDGMIRFRQVVRRISWSDDAVEIATGTDAYAADAVILATPLPPLRSVDFEPSLPAALAAAVDGLGYGTVTKTAVQFASREWPHGYATTELAAQRVYEPTIDQRGEAGILMAYTGGDGGRALAEFDEPTRTSRIEADMRSMYGITAGALGTFSRAWSNEPLAGGSYAAYRPGQVTTMWEVLRTPCGAIHLAGEHTATWTGYLEGAVESGEQAARRLTR